MEDLEAIIIPNCFNEHGCLPSIENMAPINYFEDNGVYVDEIGFKKTYGSLEGQIKRGTPFGDLIYYFASETTGPRQWLDIGTWNGKGTTTCILDGFLDANCEKHCTSLEAHPFMFPIAQENLKQHPAANKLTLLNHVLSFKEAESYFTPRSEIDPDDGHYKLFYETELTIWKNGTPATLAYKPDAVVLDGGEYSGYIDWLALPKDNLRVIFLDDVTCVKNKRVRQELLEDSKWKLLQENLSDRNGWSIFVRC